MQKSFNLNKNTQGIGCLPFVAKRRRGFTLIELLIVIAIIALLMAILVPALSRAKEMGKRAVCLNHIKQLQMAWNLYTDENNDKIPSADVSYSWNFPAIAGGPQISWYDWPHPWPHNMPPTKATNYDVAYPGNCINTGQCKEPDWKHSISDGPLYKYINDHKIYQCPVGNKGEYVTYTMVHSLNTYPGSGGTNPPAPTIKLKSQIKRTADRIIFIDEGGAGTGAFFVKYSGDPQLKWYDYPPMRHGKGTTFSFVDGHSIYKKWTDRHTLAYKYPDFSWGQQPGDNCDCDLRWMVRITWGDILDVYNCTTPGKKCDEF